MKWSVILLFAGVFLLITPIIQCEDDENISDNVLDESTGDVVDSDDEDGSEDDGSDSDVEEENDVLVLTEQNFDAVINSHDTILVEFYAPWCGHCKQLAPEYEKAAKSLKEARAGEHTVALAKVDATVESALGQRYDVTGYPTLKFFKNGEVHDYDGPRQEPGISIFMREKASPDWKPPPSDVVVLSDSNFTAFVSNEELSLVEFYAPWCGHCKKLAPEYEKAATTLKAQGIPLAKVDATEEPAIAKEHAVTGYPTLKVFRRGKEYEYKGEQKTASDIVRYMGQQKGPATKEKGTLKDVQAQFSKDDVTIVGFFESGDDAAFSTYDTFTNNIRDEYTIVHTFEKSVREHYKVNAGSVVVFNSERFHSKYEPMWHFLEIKEDTTEEDLKQFVSSHELPLVGHMSYVTKTKRYLKEGHKPLVLFFYDVDWSFDYRKATEQNRQKALQIAKDYKEYTFAVADEKESADLLKEFGLDDTAEDLSVGIISTDGKKYPMEEMEDGFDADAVRSFLNQHKLGKLKPKVKSQRPPKKQGLVTVVVGESFDKIVNDDKKDVLIEFYAPWCGHCKKLEPVYKELAKKFKKDKNVVIAKIDATANDIPDKFPVDGYPTIYWVPSDNKVDPIKYPGANEVEGMVEFIKEHATVSISQKDEL